MSAFHDMMLAGSGGQGGGASSYQIARSLRFNSADSAYLSRTPAQAGNRKTWTWAGWVKRSTLTTSDYIHLFGYSDSTSTAYTVFLIKAGDNALQIWDTIGGASPLLETSNLLRDPSAWYHIVLSADSTQASASSRIRIYINGIESSYAVDRRTTVTQNYDFRVNISGVSHEMGGNPTFSSTRYFSGYLADVHFIDGQALTPSSFGETDSNGVWQPKAYTGSYGTNGFRLDFSDNSSATSTGIGKDASGNGNNWTPTNLSVTAGADNDSLVDSPTNYGTDTGAGGEVRGNYCTFNPLAATTALANGNLDTAMSNSPADYGRGTIGVTAGKYYFEALKTGGQQPFVGIAGDTNALYYGYHGNGQIFYTGGNTGFNPTINTGDVIGIAVDATAGTVSFYRNGSLIHTGTGLTWPVYFPYYGGTGAGYSTVSWNFGQRPFAYAAPSGFKALCSQNLPDESIVTSGSFTGNANADGPFVYLKGVPTAMTINGNAVTFGTHADKLANGFKVRTSSSSYNTSGSNTYSVSTTGDKFFRARAQSN